MESVKRKISQITGFNRVEITNRGNQAIFASLEIARNINSKKYILIPDSGGWISFKNYPKYFNFVAKEIRTDDGIIDLIDLKRNLRDASALLITSFAGYFAEQDMKNIYELCSKNNVLVIEDASGSIGDDILCNSKNADIIVGSFGKYKPVNVGYGGFIATYDEYLEKARVSLTLSNPHPNSENEIMNKLNDNRVKSMINFANKVKNDLVGERFKLIHGDKRGINVMCEYNPFLLEYCSEKGYYYIVCPNYNRLNRKAISIELKRL